MICRGAYLKRLEEGLWALKHGAADFDGGAVGHLVRCFLVGFLELLQFFIVVESAVAELLFNVSDDL